MDQPLEWIGFTVQAKRNSLMDKFGTFGDLSVLKGKDVSNLADSYAKQTAADGQFYFGLIKTKRIKARIHWIQDFQRVQEVPTLDGLDQAAFCNALKVADNRQAIRKMEMDGASSSNSEASPGLLKDERKWNHWINAFENMLAGLYGTWGIP